MQLKSQKEVSSGTGHWTQHVPVQRICHSIARGKLTDSGSNFGKTLPSLPPRCYCWAWCDGMEISLVLWAERCQLCPLPNSCSPSATHWCSKAVQELFSCDWNIGVLSTLAWSQKSNPPPYRLSWRKLTPSQPHSVQQDNKNVCAVWKLSGGSWV